MVDKAAQVLQIAEQISKSAKQHEKDTKKMVNLYLERDVWNAFQQKYGRNSSKLVNDFMTELLKLEDK
jgi:uncharacterized protein (DUF4415 family)